MELYEFQKDILKKTESYNKVAYYLDMGLGKTFIGSEKLATFDTNINVIVCQKSKIDDWVNHFVANYPDFYVMDYTRKNSRKFELEKNKIIVVNYDLIWRREEFLRFKDFTLMLDESSLIQNYKTKRTQFILSLKPKNVILLSGTPVNGKYENLWSQLNLLGYDKSKSYYFNRYVNYTLVDYGYGKVPEVNKLNPYKNVEELKQVLDKYGAIFLKSDEVLELPEQREIDIICESTADYRQFLREKVIEVDGEELIGDVGLKKYLYLRELAGMYNKYKLARLQDMFDSTEDRLIIFYNFNKELEILKKLCDDNNKPYSQVNGSIKDLNAYEHFDNSVTLVQYQAGAMGINLQLANKIIYFSPTDRTDLYEQSKKRIHRIGQKSHCTYFKLIAKDTIEEDIYKALETKNNYTMELFKRDYGGRKESRK